MKENQSTIGAFFSGVFQVIAGIVILGIFIGGVIAVSRKVAGPSKTIQIVQNE
jgi:uncharacterized integral membrane protein